MGSALRLHPLLVIFGLLAGGEIYGLPGRARRPAAAGRRPGDLGVLLERVTLESWEEGPAMPVEVEIEETRPIAPVPPADPPAAASRLTPGHSCSPPAASRAGSASTPRSSRSSSRSGTARRSRSSARTAQASRRCSRCWRARSSRAAGTIERARACASAGRRSGRRSTGASPRARTSSSSRGSRASSTRRRADERCSAEFDLPGEAAPSAEPLGRQPAAPEPRDLAARRPQVSCCSTSRPPRSTPTQRRRLWSTSPRAARGAAARSSSRPRTSRRSSVSPTASLPCATAGLVFAGPARPTTDRAREPTLCRA